MEFLRTFTLKVELFAGTDIRAAAAELCQLADRIGVMCEASFNGVKLWARPGDYPPLLVEAYEEQLQSKSTHKIAQASRSCKTASGCSHTARSDDQSKVDDQEPTTGSSHG